MQTIFNLFVDGDRYDNDLSERKRDNEKELSVMLECGAKILFVTPILSTRHDQGSQSYATYTRYLSYIIEEPDTDEYRKTKNDKLREFHERVNALSHRYGRGII